MKRSLYFLLLILISCVATKSSVTSTYVNAINGLNEPNKEIATRLNVELLKSEGNGAAILSVNCTSIISEENTQNSCDETSNEAEIWIASSQYDGKTLSIDLGQIFHYEALVIEVQDNSIKSFYKQWDKNEKLFKVDIEDNPAKEILVPLILQEIELSKTKDFTYGEQIYGSLKIETQAFYVKNPSFEKRKRDIECLFTFRVRKPISEWQNGFF